MKTEKKAVGAAMVVGGGIAGMQAALDLAASGVRVYLVESAPAIGGKMVQLDKTFPTNDCATCIISPKLVEVAREPNVTVLTNSEVIGAEGEAGSFRVRVKEKARYVDLAKCTGCADCEAACVLKNRVPSEFNAGIANRSAIYIPFAQAVPRAAVVDPKSCLLLRTGRCNKACVKACQADAIDFDQKEASTELEVGAILLAPGYEPYDARLSEEFGFGRYPNVVTSLQFERLLSPSGPTKGHVQRPSDKKEPRKIAFLQCIGSRDQKHPYCSSVCCMYATKEAMLIKEHHPATDVSIFMMDIRSFGKGFEAYYDRARVEQGVKYIRCRPSSLKEVAATENLVVRYQAEDGGMVEEEFDMVVLSVGMEPAKGAQDLARALDVKLNEDGFCQTSKFAPLDTTRPGIFACGPFVEPCDIPDSVTQASGAAARCL